MGPAPNCSQLGVTAIRMNWLRRVNTGRSRLWTTFPASWRNFLVAGEASKFPLESTIVFIVIVFAQ